MTRQPLGQHFLVSPMPARVLSDGLAITSKDTVVEIGPGKGALTRMLVAKQPKKLILVEKDIELAANLVRFYAEQELSFVEIVHGDIREVLPELAPTLPLGWKLIGNIPYYLTSNLLRSIGELEHLPSCTGLLIQKEVAERVCAQEPYMNKLAAHVGVWADAQFLREIPPSAFSPQPKVDSALILLTTKINTPNLSERKLYSKVITILFKQPRKVLGNNLADGIREMSKSELLSLLAPLGVTSTTRGHELSITHIKHITEALRGLVE